LGAGLGFSCFLATDFERDDSLFGVGSSATFLGGEVAFLTLFDLDRFVSFFALEGDLLEGDFEVDLA